MKKKVFLTGLVSVLAISSLVACGKKSSQGAAANKDLSNIIKIAYKDENASNPNSKKYFDELSKLMKEKDGVDVVFEVVDLPGEGYQEKLNLQISSGDIPDIIYFQGGDTMSAEQGLLEDLNPYIKKSTYIKNIIEPHNEKRLENYPYLMWIKPATASVPVIKKKILEETQIGKEFQENPTVDNYTKLFKEVIGKKDEKGQEVKYAITTSGNTNELDSIFDMAFGNTQTWQKTDKGYIYKRVSENEKEKIAYYKSLYDEKLLDNQFITKKWDTKENAFYDGETALIAGTSGKVIDMYSTKAKELSGSELVVLPPAKGKSQGYGAVNLSKEDRGLAIYSQSANKDLAFKVLDFLASPEGQQLDRLGFENEHYKIEGEKITVLDESGEWYAKFWEPKELKVTKELSSPLLGEEANKSIDLVSEYYSEDNSFIIPDDMVAKWDAAENVYKETIADMITGKKSIDEFDKFVKQWQESGGQEITDYANEKLK